ncbi:hypothetical protein A4X13_0g9185 [Tilletia indica]|uniref:Uncharacterized protein n=1 Tax=Tilletia indica TaxID=43049 RepID=A0A8T8SAW3_9BASI|nr:hypothetical protein A4X13_0g9185 [Tilletia indica]
MDGAGGQGVIEQGGAEDAVARGSGDVVLQAEDVFGLEDDGDVVVEVGIGASEAEWKEEGMVGEDMAV